MLICTKAYFKKNQRYIKTTYTIYNLILFQKSMLSYQSIVKKQEMTERVKRHPPAYRRKQNMAKRKGQKRRNQKYQVNNRQLKAKRMYKDTIFRMLYHDKENLLSLYNAVNGREYTDPEKLQVVTLENAIYMGMKNDLAFIMDMNLYLYEHQSTYNPNIPLRNLFYIADEYQRLVVRKSLYSTVIQKIPTPRFIVFYNGTKKVDDYNEFRLSSAYENPTDDPDLELKVTMLNVNDGHNLELMEHCRTLKEYAKYVARVRKYVTQNIPLEEAVTRAVDECIEEGILAEFLVKNKAEVIKVSIYEYDKEFEEKKLRKAEYEAGVEAGVESGIELGERSLLKKQIKKKLKKRKSIGQIADELEEEVTAIQRIIEEIQKEG